jgi:hypothetical protein
MTSLRSTTAGLAAAIVFAAAVAPGRSAPPGPRDPDWPCQQIKVPQLSLAAVWSGPPLDRQREDWRHDQKVVDMVQAMAQRRVPIEQAQDRFRVFAAQAGERKQPQLLDLLAGLFSVLNDEHSTVIAGLDRFGARQKALAAELRDDNEKLRAMQANPAANAGDVAQITQRVTWEAQVFQDRRQAIGYACDVPGKIEHRLFALARTIQEELQ